MQYTQSSNQTIYLRLAKGEAILPAIQAVCRQENITGGSFTGIGACSTATLATYIPEKADFIDHDFTGMLELVSLNGNISLDHDQQPYLHAHASFSYLDDDQHVTLTGGHLKAATIGYTGEMVITPAGFDIHRQFDQAAGIDVWQLPAK